MKRTYQDMSRELGLEIDYDHPVNWANTKNFLKLCAVVRDPSLNDPTQPVWVRVYRTVVAARKVGDELRVRVPRRFWKLDRYIVLAGVAGLSNEVPLRRQAFDWARR
jgi:hypothetical protein